MRKIINSATTQYEPVLTEELVLDDRPISGSFNSITSDAVYKAISVDPGNVPPVESTDNGKVLTASYGEGGGSFEWADSPKELPASLGTAGQVLQVNAGGTGVEWATPSGGGSTYTAGDGIAISAQDEISAKVGGGVTIGNASGTGPVTDDLSVTPVNPEGTRIYPIFGRLTADTANALASGSVTIKTLINWSSNTGATFYRPCIFTYESTWGYNTQNRLVFGTNAISGSITANTEIVYDINDVNASMSERLTIETVLANPTNYVFFAVPCSSDGTPNYSAFYYSSASSTAAAVISTASYQGTVTVPNSIILERPVPAYAAGDAGKVLSVNAGGTGVEWATPSGGGGGGSSDVVVHAYPSDTSTAALTTLYNTIVSEVTAGKAVFLTGTSSGGKNYPTIPLICQQTIQDEYPINQLLFSGCFYTTSMAYTGMRSVTVRLSYMADHGDGASAYIDVQVNSWSAT